MPTLNDAFVNALLADASYVSVLNDAGDLIPASIENYVIHDNHLHT